MALSQEFIRSLPDAAKTFWPTRKPSIDPLAAIVVGELNKKPSNAADIVEIFSTNFSSISSPAANVRIQAILKSILLKDLHEKNAKNILWLVQQNSKNIVSLWKYFQKTEHENRFLEIVLNYLMSFDITRAVKLHEEIKSELDAEQQKSFKRHISSHLKEFVDFDMWNLSEKSFENWDMAGKNIQEISTEDRLGLRLDRYNNFSWDLRRDALHTVKVNHRYLLPENPTTRLLYEAPELSSNVNTLASVSVDVVFENLAEVLERNPVKIRYFLRKISDRPADIAKVIEYVGSEEVLQKIIDQQLTHYHQDNQGKKIEEVFGLIECLLELGGDAVKVAERLFVAYYDKWKTAEVFFQKVVSTGSENHFEAYVRHQENPHLNVLLTLNTLRLALLENSSESLLDDTIRVDDFSCDLLSELPFDQVTDLMHYFMHTGQIDELMGTLPAFFAHHDKLTSADDDAAVERMKKDAQSIFNFLLEHDGKAGVKLEEVFASNNTDDSSKAHHFIFMYAMQRAIPLVYLLDLRPTQPALVDAYIRSNWNFLILNAENVQLLQQNFTAAQWHSFSLSPLQTGEEEDASLGGSESDDDDDSQYGDLPASVASTVWTPGSTLDHQQGDENTEAVILENGSEKKWGMAAANIICGAVNPATTTIFNATKKPKRLLLPKKQRNSKLQLIIS